MEKDVILERLLATEEYAVLKKHVKQSALLAIPTTIALFALSWLMMRKDLFSFASILVYLCTIILCYGLKKYIEEGYFRKEPIYDTSIIQKTRKINISHDLDRYYWIEYLVTFNGQEIWAKDFRGYKDSTGNRFDSSKLQVGHSVIVFKLSPNGLYYIVSNE